MRKQPLVYYSEIVVASSGGYVPGETADKSSSNVWVKLR